MAHDVFSVLDPRSASVLRRLHAESDRQIPAVLGHLVRTTVAARLPGRARTPTPAHDDYTDDKYLALGRAQAAFCYTQARAVGARTVVEFGTSFGVSTLWLAAAVRDNGGGRVIGTEMVPEKAERAAAHLAEAGLEEFVEIRVGDALETLRDVEGPVDLLLNDGFPEGALPVLEMLAPVMRPGAVVVTDNVVMRGAYTDYVRWLRDPSHGFVSLRVPFRGGTELSVRA